MTEDRMVNLGTRPPTVIYNNMSKSFYKTQASYFKISRNQLELRTMPHSRDDGSLIYESMMSDSYWNNRHHVSTSNFNNQNHTYYKQYFDKPTRNTQTF